MSGESGAGTAEASEATELASQPASGDGTLIAMAEAHSELDDAVPAAGTHSASDSVVPGAEPPPRSGDEARTAQEPFESEEERFFSEPPDLYDETTTPSFELESSRVERTARPDAVTVTRVALPSEHHPPSEPLLEDPGVAARRRQLRARVASMLCAMVVVLLLGFVARKRSEAARLAREAVIPTPRAVPALMPTAVSSPPILTAHAELAVEIPPPAVASSQADSVEPPSEEDSATLTSSARTLLGAGKVREGVTLARQAVEKNPFDAEPYVLLAAGLQDLGQWSEAREVFAACRQKTKRGPSSTCQYFARR